MPPEPPRWRCAICAKRIRHSHFKRHLAYVHADHDQARVNREWILFLTETGQLPESGPVRDAMNDPALPLPSPRGGR